MSEINRNEASKYDYLKTRQYDYLKTRQRTSSLDLELLFVWLGFIGLKQHNIHIKLLSLVSFN